MTLSVQKMLGKCSRIVEKIFLAILKDRKGMFERGLIGSVGGLVEDFRGLLGKNLRVSG